MHQEPSATADTTRRGWALSCAEWLLPAACLLITLPLPLTRDSGLFAYAGNVILDGGHPYVDVLDQKGPAIYYTYALATLLFGRTEIGVRIFFYLVLLAGTRLAASIGSRIAGRQARLPCALCYAVAMIQGDADCAWWTAQAEDLILPLTLGAVVLAGNERGLLSGRRMLLAGALLGSACLFKPTTGMTAAAIGAVAIAWLARRNGAERLARYASVGWAAVGLVLPTLLTVAYFAYVGALDEFWAVVVEFNLGTYASQASDESLQGSFGTVWTRWWPLLVLALCWLSWGRKHDRLMERFVWTAFCGAWLAVIWQAKFLYYHWTPMLGCLAILAGCGVVPIAQSVARRIRRPSLRHVIPTATMILLPVLAAPADLINLAYVYKFGGSALAGSMSLDQFRGLFRTGASNATNTRLVAAYLRERTDPDEAVLVWGHEALVNFLAQRRSPTRFVVDGYLTTPSARQAEWRKEFIQKLRRCPPPYIVVVCDDATSFEPEDSWTQLRRFEPLAALLETQYRHEITIAEFQVYRHHWKTPHQALDGVRAVLGNGGDNTANQLRARTLANTPR